MIEEEENGRESSRVPFCLLPFCLPPFCLPERTLERAKQTLGIRSVWVDGGKKKAIYWLLPGQLPEDVRVDQVKPIETQQQELEAMNAESMERWLELGEGARSVCP
jgi:hypothetical protein